MLNCNLRFSSAMETVACSRYAPVAFIPLNFQHSRIIKSLKLCKLPGGLFKRNISKKHRLRYRPLVASAKGRLKGDPDEETRKPYLVEENDSTAVQFNEHPLAFGSSISSMEPLIDDDCLFEEESVGEKIGRDLAVIKTKPSSVIQIPGLPDGNNASSITSGSWEWKDKWIVNYEKAGSQNVGAPAVLFLPGFGVGSFHYENQLRDLGRNFRVWSVDFLGQGRSLPCEDPAPPVREADSEANTKYWGFGPQAEPWASELVYSVDLWRDQIRNFVEQVIGEPIYVVGNSLGGFVGLYFAACYPQLVRGITLLNATPFWAFIPNSSRSPNMAKFFPWAGNFPVPPIARKLIEFFWSKISQPEAIKNVLKQVYVDHSAMTDELLLRILEAAEHPAAAASFASIIFAPQGELSFNETLLRLVRMCRCQEMNIPICLIYGREDPWVRPQWGQLVKKQVPDAVYYEISPAGHCPHSEVPEVVNFLLRGWIENRESQASVALPLYDDPSLLHLDLWREIEFERKGLRRLVQVRVVRSKSLFWKNWKNLLSVFQPLLRIFGDRARETGMNLLNNARNSMIDNFRSIKWLFHELEEVKEQVRHIEATRKGMDANRRTGSADRLSLAERRIHNLENYNHNLANQMFSLLSSINNNIISLMGWIKDREMQDDEEGKARDEARREGDSVKDNTIPDQDQGDQRAQQLEAEENQLAFEAAQVMQELERKSEE